jgi:hypothetical protein
MRDCGGFDAVSKTVDGGNVVRGFESLPLRSIIKETGDVQRFWLVVGPRQAPLAYRACPTRGSARADLALHRESERSRDDRALSLFAHCESEGSR